MQENGKNGKQTQHPAGIPFHHERNGEHFIVGDQVLCIKVNHGIVFSHTARVLIVRPSDASGHLIVWGNRPFNYQAPTMEKAHEQRFDIACRELLKFAEARILGMNSEAAIHWFKGAYPPEVARKISKHFRMPDTYDEDAVKWQQLKPTKTAPATKHKTEFHSKLLEAMNR